MEISKRIEIYKSIEEYRQRPLIIYATSTRIGAGVFMASDSVRELIDQVDKIKDSKAVDILIHSSGGDSLAAWKLMSVLRERFKEVNVLVPFMAFSAATIFSLGANEIVMHPHSSLGPIDPQITVTKPDGARQFSYEDVGAYLRFLKDEVGITEQAFEGPLVDKIFSAVDPIVIGAAKRASELSTAVGERLLRMHLTDPSNKNTARQIAENLNKSFFAHGDAVSRSRARELNLPIAEDDPKLEKLIWEAYLGIEDYMELRKAFDPIKHFLADARARESLTPSAPFILPPNTPPQISEQLWNNIAKQAINGLNQSGIQVDYLLIHALIESVRFASECYTIGNISATRLIGGDIQVSMLPIESGWRNLPISPSPKERKP
jgi:hypothetical protein